MFHQPPKDFLYAAYQVNVEQSDGVKRISGMATAFIVAMDNNQPLIVTNRHVIDRDYKQQTSKYKDFAISKIILTGRKQDDSEYSVELGAKSEIYYHDNSENDIVLVSPRVKSEDINSFHYHFGLEHLADEKIYQTINPFDVICYTGFPNTHDKYANRPILRSGNIASDPRYNYSWNKNHQGECVAYEGFSSEGASGSPVFAPPRGAHHIEGSRHGYLIGVNAGHIPDTGGHSGISFFYKSTLIFEIIAKYGLNSKVG